MHSFSSYYERSKLTSKSRRRWSWRQKKINLLMMKMLVSILHLHHHHHHHKLLLVHNLQFLLQLHCVQYCPQSSFFRWSWLWPCQTCGRTLWWRRHTWRWLALGTLATCHWWEDTWAVIGWLVFTLSCDWSIPVIVILLACCPEDSRDQEMWPSPWMTSWHHWWTSAGQEEERMVQTHNSDSELTRHHTLTSDHRCLASMLANL